jgi:hypothetical protein
VLRKSEAALDKAMEGTPVLGYVGKDEQQIVGWKPDLPSAARLIELQGKAVGLFQDDNAMKLAVLVDVDFSGRRGDPVIEVTKPALDASFVDAVIEDQEVAAEFGRRDELASVDAEIRRAEAAAVLTELDDDSWLD